MTHYYIHVLYHASKRNMFTEEISDKINPFISIKYTKHNIFSMLSCMSTLRYLYKWNVTPLFWHSCGGRLGLCTIHGVSSVCLCMVWCMPLSRIHVHVCVSAIWMQKRSIKDRCTHTTYPVCTECRCTMNNGKHHAHAYQWYNVALNL